MIKRSKPLGKSSQSEQLFPADVSLPGKLTRSQRKISVFQNSFNTEESVEFLLRARNETK